MKLNDVASYLSLTVLYEDQDMQEIEVQACNGSFAGTAAIYVSHGELAALAEQLTRLIQLTFHCVSGAGHAAVKVVLDSGDEQVEMQVRFQSAEMDDFCRQVEAVATGKYRQAIL